MPGELGLDTIGVPVQPASGVLVLNASRIRDFETCKRRFFLKWVIRMRGDDTDDFGAAALGSSVHAELHARHQDPDRHDDDDTVSEEVSLDQQGLNLVRAHSNVCPRGTAAYVDGEIDLRWLILRKAVLLTGRVDALWRYPDGTIEVRDYKTGSVPDDLTTDLGALIYGVLGVANHPDAPRVRVVYEALRHGDGALVSMDVTPEIVHEGYRRILDIATHIRGQRTFPASPAPSACGPCEFRSLCPHAAAERTG